MTPSALTPAARGSTKKSRPDAQTRPSSARGAGHRSTVRRSVTPAAARRVSGPSGGVAAASAAAVSGGVIAVPAPTRTRPANPARSPRPARPRSTRRAAAKAPWRLRASAYLRALPDHALLDRIIRGRVWIPLLGVLLAGIVAMQVEVLKLNAGIGRSLERGSALQGQNELLRANVARLSDEQRIERMAAQMGMVMPAPTQLRFVRGGKSGVERALNSIHAPNGTNFIAQLPPIGAPAAAQGTSLNTGVGVTPTTASSTASTAGTTDTTASSGTPSSSATGTTAGGIGTGASTSSSTATGTPATTGSSSGATSGASTVTPTAPTTSAGATDQSGSSSSGGATPVGG
jgi:hypothetical protein